MVAQYAGTHWGEELPPEPIPINLISLYVGVVGRNLIPKSPRVMLSTFDRGSKPVVTAMQSWCNQEIEVMKLADTLQRIVVDALFSIGIAKVALATPPDSAGVAWNLRAGNPFCERVDLDDFVVDPHARDWNGVSFIGHRYRCPLEVAKDFFKRKSLIATDDAQYNEPGDERISTLGRTGATDDEEFEDHIDLWEIYLPRYRQVITLSSDQVSSEADEPALKVQRWIGPDEGPYRILSLVPAPPGNLMPKGPIMDLTDLHLAVNRSYQKAIDMVDRMKENLYYMGAASEDAERVTKAKDGEAIRVDNVDKIKQVVSSGNALNAVYLMAEQMKQSFDWLAGNVSIMGGLAAQSKTATQDTMLDQNSSRGIADMQARTVNFTSDVLKSLCWYWWNDPLMMARSKHKVGSAEINRDVYPRGANAPLARNGRFEELDIRVDPYSLQHQTPQSRMAAINQVFQTIILPLMPILQQQGISVDLNALLQKIAVYMDMPDLQDVVTIVAPPQASGAGGPAEPPGMPAQTERKYVRENRSERTQQGTLGNLMHTMRGQNPGGNPNGIPMPTNGAM